MDMLSPERHIALMLARICSICSRLVSSGSFMTASYSQPTPAIAVIVIIDVIVVVITVFIIIIIVITDVISVDVIVIIVVIITAIIVASYRPRTSNRQPPANSLMNDHHNKSRDVHETSCHKIATRWSRDCKTASLTFPPLTRVQYVCKLVRLFYPLFLNRVSLCYRLRN